MTNDSPLLTVAKCLPQGRGLAPVLLKRAASVALDWDVRQKSRAPKRAANYPLPAARHAL